MKWIKDYDFHFLNSDKLDSSGQYTKEFQGRLYPEHIKFIKDLLDKQKQEEREKFKKMILEISVDVPKINKESLLGKDFYQEYLSIQKRTIFKIVEQVVNQLEKKVEKLTNTK